MIVLVLMAVALVSVIIFWPRSRSSAPNVEPGTPVERLQVDFMSVFWPVVAAIVFCSVVGAVILGMLRSFN